MAARGAGERVYPNEDWGGLIGLGMLGFAAFLLVYNFERYLSPATARDFFILLFNLFVFSVGVYMVVIGVPALLSSVRLYDGGLVVHTGPRRTSVTWDEVVAVTGGIPLRDRGVPLAAGRCVLELKDGRRIAIPNTVRSYADLTERIQAAALARLGPDAERALRAGGELQFGPVAIRADGVRAAGRFVPWIESVEVAFPQRGTGFISPAPATLALFAAGAAQPWANVPLGAIPNAHLFLTLARAFAHEGGHELRLVRHYSLDLAFAPLAVEVPKPPPTPPAPAVTAPTPEPTHREPPAVPLSMHAVTWRSAVLQSEAGAGICFILAGLCLIVLFISVFAALFNGRDPNADVLYLLIPAAAFALGGSVQAWLQVMQICVSDEGLTLVRRGRVRQRPWGEVAEVHIEEKLLNGVTRVSRCVVTFTDRRALGIDMSLSNYDEFLRSVQRAVTLFRLPTARRALAAGEELAFGPVRIGFTGIGVHKNWVTWEWLERVYIGDGHLVVRPREAKGHKCPLAEIPNYLVLLNLIHDHAGARFEGFG